MRRIVMWFLSTVTAVVLLFGYHTSTSGPSSASTAVVASGEGISGSLGGSSARASSGSGSGSSSGSSSSTSKTVSGDTVDTRWGPVQVEITVAGGTITEVNVPVYPSNNPKDQEINSYALPTLVQETLSAQSADIDMVSGATVTSDGYLQSLQSALDGAGL
jgi:uncharacterized protein with FMN-binding domain